MERRSFLTGLGTGAATLIGGCSNSLSSTTSPNHLVQLSNQRATSHEVVVELEITGDEREYGPKTVVANSQWDVEQITSTGELTLQVSVDDESVLDDTHDVPTPGENRTSYAAVRLESDGEVTAFVEEED